MTNIELLKLTASKYDVDIKEDEPKSINGIVKRNLNDNEIIWVSSKDNPIIKMGFSKDGFFRTAYNLGGCSGVEFNKNEIDRHFLSVFKSCNLNIPSLK